MYEKIIVATGMSVLIFLALAGFALAGDIGTEAGDSEYKFDSPDQAVEGYQYDQEKLARIGTEAGDSEYRFDAPETKAEIAAKNYSYDQESLALVGTEAGDSEFKGNSESSERTGKADNEFLANDSKGKESMCKGC